MTVSDSQSSNILLQESEIDAVAVVHSYEDGMPAVAHKIRLTALNVSFSEYCYILASCLIGNYLIILFQVTIFSLKNLGSLSWQNISHNNKLTF